MNLQRKCTEMQKGQDVLKFKISHFEMSDKPVTKIIKELNMSLGCVVTGY